jgi:glycosyltransferase involved in cell wall biosynthesis
MYKMTTLGICIPTYKRPEFLKRCVESAVYSSKGLPIKIYIADDSISDVNKDVINELQSKYPFIHVKYNEINLGIDDNIQCVVDMCACDYAWLIGEDDTFLPDAIARIHALLQTTGAAFVYANYHFVGNDPATVLSQTQLTIDGGTMPADQFISQHLWAIGFIGACIVRCKEWRCTDPKPYNGTYYTHVGRISEIMCKTGSLYVTKDCSVANRVEGGGAETFTWWSDSYGVLFGFVKMCQAVKSRQPDHAIALQTASDSFRSNFLTIRLALRLRAESSFNIIQYNKYIKNSDDISKIKKTALKLIASTPSKLLMPMVLVYRLVRKFK